MNGNSQHSKQLEEERREGNGPCSAYLEPVQREGKWVEFLVTGVETSREWTEGGKIDHPARSNANTVKSC